MIEVSNQKLCGGYTENVGFYYRVTFPVGTGGLIYSFRNPVDFGNGGVSMLDGVIMKEEESDIWENG